MITSLSRTHHRIQNREVSVSQDFVTQLFSTDTEPLSLIWRVNVLYFVGIGSQPEKTWRHRKLTAPEVIVRIHGKGGINKNMAAQQTPRTSRLAMNARSGSATMVMAE